MAENNKNINQINSNTQIVFTVKSFFALISTIIGLFFGFYQLVVVPKMNNHDEQYKTIIKDQKEQNKLFYDELGKINSAINTLNTSIIILNNSRSVNTGTSTSGSLSSTPTTLMFNTPQTDLSEAINN